MAERFDAVVVGAGFGGLGAALTLAERGLRTALLERLVYPGGCASTFARDGYRFESGATLFSGFGPGQWFERLLARHRVPVEVEWLDPVIELRTERWRLPVPRERAAFERRLLELPGAPREALSRFLARQRRVADVLWPLLDDPERLPPLGPRGLAHHARRLHRYGPLAAVAGRSLADVARRDGVLRFEPLRVLLDALSQITIQCSAEEAEAPFALATLDYPFRGTGHVRGGVGELARGLCDALERAGGEVRYATRARAVERDPARGTWRVHTPRGSFEAPRLVLNLLPQDARRLLREGGALGAGAARAERRLERDARAVAGGWGACMLYLVAREPDGAGPGPKHLELVQDPSRPFLSGNHLFVSISGRDESGPDAVGSAGPRAPAGRRTITVSTHCPMDRYLGLADGPDGPRARFVAEVQERAREGLRRLAPEWWEGVEHELTASPRTFERFTGRAHGFVGGVPRRRGLAQYLDAGTRVLAPGLALVGDTVFPGQSTLAAALGGAKAAARLVR